LTVAYRGTHIDPSWISKLSSEFGATVALLGGSVEAHHEGTLGRVEIGLSGIGEARAIEVLDGWGLHATAHLQALHTGKVNDDTRVEVTV